jgi:hypothetical protein
MPGQPDHDGSGQSEDDHDPVGDEHRSHPARIRHTKREPSRQKPRRRRCCLRRPRNAQPRCALSEPPYGPDHRPPGGNAFDLDRTFKTTPQTGVALEVHGLPQPTSPPRTSAALLPPAGASGAQATASATYAVRTARRGGAPAAAVVDTRRFTAYATLRGRR